MRGYCLAGLACLGLLISSCFVDSDWYEPNDTLAAELRRNFEGPGTERQAVKLKAPVREPLMLLFLEVSGFIPREDSDPESCRRSNFRVEDGSRGVDSLGIIPIPKFVDAKLHLPFYMPLHLVDLVEVWLDGSTLLASFRKSEPPASLLEINLAPMSGLGLDSSHEIRMRTFVQGALDIQLGREFREGPHQIEFRATGPGVETSTFVCFDYLFNATSTHIDSDGNIWVGTFDNGLYKFDAGPDTFSSADDSIEVLGGDSLNVTLFGNQGDSVKGKLSGNSITRLAQDSRGLLWIGTFINGFSVMGADGQVAKYRLPSASEATPDINFTLSRSTDEFLDLIFRQSVTGFEFIDDKHALISTLNGLFLFAHGGTPMDPSDDSFVQLGAPDQLPDANIAAIAWEKPNRIWIASYDVQPEEGEAAEPSLTVLDFAGTPANLTDNTWTFFGPQDGLASEEVLSIAVDAGGRKWIGTARGLNLLEDLGTSDKSDDRWTLFTTADGLPDPHVSAIHVLSDRELLLGSLDILRSDGSGGGLTYLNHFGTLADKRDDTVVNYRLDDGLLDSDITSIAVDKKGRVYVSTFNLTAAGFIGELIENQRNRPTGGGGRGGRTTGVDGLTVIDPGASWTDKSDDIVFNY